MLSIDVETKCGVGCESACEHALDPKRNAITVIGVAWREGSEIKSNVFRDVAAFNAWLPSDAQYLGFNFKFDFHTLKNAGANLDLLNWAHDASLMASVYTRKVDQQFIEDYETRRKELNALLPKGKGHRHTSGSSLKILAPYFLKVEPFWETPDNHDNDEYVTKDAVYTLRLYEYFLHVMDQEGSLDFYTNKLIKWVRLLVLMEERGIKLDLDALTKAEAASIEKAEEAKRTLDFLWRGAYRAYQQEQVNQIRQKYQEMSSQAQAKIKDPTPEKLKKIDDRYNKLFEKAAQVIEPSINLDSPSQMKWLLKDHFNLSLTDFNEEESTGKPVLKRLAGEGRQDIKTLLEYREQRKLGTAFFPSYREMAVDGVLHCSFNPTATRTGRLSSSGPNLQQVPKGLHNLFIARDGYKLIVKDQAAIEPRLIAFMSEDPMLFSILEKGLDFHGYNTRIFFDLDCQVADVKKLYPLEREVGKEVGLAILYGAGAIRLQESAQKRGFIWSETECRDKVKKFREEYQGVVEFQRKLNLQLEAGAVPNLFGRPVYVEDPRDIHMKGLNSLIQGSASDLVLNSAYLAQKEFYEKGIDAHILLLVHDEIVLEAADEDVEQAEAIIDRCMTNYPLDIKWGRITLKTEGKTGRAWEK